MTVTGPDFVALQVRDVQLAAAFYEKRLGLQRAASSPPNAVVFDTAPTRSRSANRLRDSTWTPWCPSPERAWRSGSAATTPKACTTTSPPPG